MTAWQVERHQSSSVAGQPGCAGLALHTTAFSLNLFIWADCMLHNPEFCRGVICSCLSLMVPKIHIPVSSDKQGCSHLLPLEQVTCFIFHGRKPSLPLTCFFTLNFLVPGAQALPTWGSHLSADTCSSPGTWLSSLSVSGAAHTPWAEALPPLVPCSPACGALTGLHEKGKLT